MKIVGGWSDNEGQPSEDGGRRQARNAETTPS